MTSDSSGRYTLDKVSSEALAEIAKELDSGKREALEQLQILMRETKDEVTKILDGSERQAESLKRQMLGSAELEARNVMLRTLDDTVHQIFKEALKKITEESLQYEKSLTKLIAEGVEVIGKDAIIACNNNDKKLVSSIIKDLNAKNHSDLTLDENGVETIGGVILYSKGRIIRFDNTFEARLGRLKPQLRRDVITILTEDAQSA
jgi:V/A-type H+-transporting ATPase subunit E